MSSTEPAHSKLAGYLKHVGKMQKGLHERKSLKEAKSWQQFIKSRLLQRLNTMFYDNFNIPIHFRIFLRSECHLLRSTNIHSHPFCMELMFHL